MRWAAAVAFGLIVGAATVAGTGATSPRPVAGPTTPTTVPAQAQAPAPAAGASSTAAATTVPAAVTTVPAATGAPTTTLAPLPEPESAAADPVRTLVPRIAVVPAVLNDEVDRREAIDAALAEPGSAIALKDGPGTICAIVPIATPLAAAGRWERDGEPIAESDEARRDPPGYGDCLPNADGEPFPEGVYQYVAVGPTGAYSAAGTVVVGTLTVVVWLLNNSDAPVCLVHISPEPADYYEALATDGPLLPGEAIAIRVADVDQDVRLFGCPPDDVLRTIELSPREQTYVDMFDPADPADTTTPVAGSPTEAPATTDAP